MSERWSDLLYYGLAGLIALALLIAVLAIVVFIAIIRDVTRERKSHRSDLRADVLERMRKRGW